MLILTYLTSFDRVSSVSSWNRDCEYASTVAPSPENASLPMVSEAARSPSAPTTGDATPEEDDDFAASFLVPLDILTGLDLDGFFAAAVPPDGSCYLSSVPLELPSIP